MSSEIQVDIKISEIKEQYLQALDNLHLKAEEEILDEVDLEYALDKIHKIYGVNLGIKDTQTVTRHYLSRRNTTLDVKKYYTIKEVINFKNNELTGSIVPRLVPTGVTIIRAPAKQGKSRLIYALLKSIYITKEFLGLPTRRCGITIVYQAEEPMTIVRNRFLSNRFDDDDNPDVRDLIENDKIIIVRQINIAKGIDQIKRDVRKFSKKHKVDLIVVDTLRAAMRSASVSENSADWANPSGLLQDYANGQNIAIILLHHHNKNGKSSGTSALDGNANMLWDVTYYEGEKYSKKSLVIKTTPRDGTGASFVVDFKKDLKLLEEEGVTPDLTTLEVKIINLLKQEENREGVVDLGLSVEELAEQLGVESIEKLELALDRLLESSFLESNRSKGKNFYYIPNYILELYGDLGILGKAEELDLRLQDISVQVQSATTKQEFLDAFKGMTVRDKEVVFRLLPIEEQERLKSLT
jgi:hypothetical protein